MGNQRKSEQNPEKTHNKMTDLNPNISILTVNVNGLYTPKKRQKWAEWVKSKTWLYAVYERYTLKKYKWAECKWRGKDGP